MRKIHALLPLIALLAGCTNRDTDCLTRIGRKVVDRANSATEAVREKIDWPGFRNGNGGNNDNGGATLPAGATLQEKIAGRLRWDKNLEGVQIEVLVSENHVELKGTVKNQDMRFRAVELTETTLGVERVTDSLVVSEP